MHPLLRPEVFRIIPPSHTPARDRAPQELSHGTPAPLREDLEALIGKEQVHGRLIDLVRYATDASPYRMFPKVVVSPRNEQDVAAIFAYAKEKGLTVTIRAAGSSL